MGSPSLAVAAVAAGRVGLWASGRARPGGPGAALGLAGAGALLGAAVGAAAAPEGAERLLLGRGDPKTLRGKLAKGVYGKARPRKKNWRKGREELMPRVPHAPPVDVLAPSAPPREER